MISDFNATLIRTAQDVLGLSNLTDSMMTQCQHPGQFGGIFLTNPHVKLQVSHLASLSSSWSHTFAWLQRHGISQSAAFCAMNTMQASQALHDLASSKHPDQFVRSAIHTPSTRVPCSPSRNPFPSPFTSPAFHPTNHRHSTTRHSPIHFSHPSTPTA